MSWDKTLLSKGIVLQGNFHFTGKQNNGRPENGMHFNTFIHTERILTTVGLVKDLAKDFATLATPHRATCVVSPTAESAAIGQATADELGVPFCFLGNEFRFREEFIETVRGKRVVLLETTIHGSGATVAAIKAIKSAGGGVVLVLSIWNHSEGTLRVKPKVINLVNQDFSVWTLRGCLEHGPCSRGVPLKRHPGGGADLEAMYQANKLNLPEGAALQFID